MERSASTNAIPNNPIPFINALRKHNCQLHRRLHQLQPRRTRVLQQQGPQALGIHRIHQSRSSRNTGGHRRHFHCAMADPVKCCKIFTIVLLALSILHVDLLLASFFGLVLITNFKRDPCLYMACIIYNVILIMLSVAGTVFIWFWIKVLVSQCGVVVKGSEVKRDGGANAGLNFNLPLPLMRTMVITHLAINLAFLLPNLIMLFMARTHVKKEQLPVAMRQQQKVQPSAQAQRPAPKKRNYDNPY